MIPDVLLVAAIRAFSWVTPSALFLRKVRKAGTGQNDKVEHFDRPFAFARNYPCASKPGLSVQADRKHLGPHCAEGPF
jgi:hypothetical protein